MAKLGESVLCSNHSQFVRLNPSYLHIRKDSSFCSPFSWTLWTHRVYSKPVLYQRGTLKKEGIQDVSLFYPLEIICHACQPWFSSTVMRIRHGQPQPRRFTEHMHFHQLSNVHQRKRPRKCFKLFLTDFATMWPRVAWVSEIACLLLTYTLTQETWARNWHTFWTECSINEEVYSSGEGKSHIFF